uniref:Gag-pol polyprotein n=1 Tax=Caenorhabditis tropicalis TaxID=1561998 RepID=A0A1I7TI49_9PELO
MEQAACYAIIVVEGFVMLRKINNRPQYLKRSFKPSLRGFLVFENSDQIVTKRANRKYRDVGTELVAKMNCQHLILKRWSRPFRCLGMLISVNIRSTRGEMNFDGGEALKFTKQPPEPLQDGRFNKAVRQANRVDFQILDKIQYEKLDSIEELLEHFEINTDDSHRGGTSSVVRLRRLAN